MRRTHKWRTNFIVIDFVDHASGMICDCGQILTQDEVENILNKHFMTFIRRCTKADLREIKDDAIQALRE